MAGYSGTPLAKKLGVGGGAVAALGAPPHLPELLAPLPDGARIVGRLPRHADVVLFFVAERRRLEQEIDELT